MTPIGPNSAYASIAPAPISKIFFVSTFDFIHYIPPLISDISIIKAVKNTKEQKKETHCESLYDD